MSKRPREEEEGRPTVRALLPPTQQRDGPIDPLEIILLNIGGTIVHTTAATLLSEPSRLVDDFYNGFPILRDAKGIPFYDRDPASFRHLLCYLRGYPLQLFPEETALLSEESDYFGLKGLRLLVGSIPSDTAPRFLPGPGVSTDGISAQSSRLVSLVGSPIMAGETVCVSFRIEKATRVCVGLVPEGIPLDNTIYGLPNSIVYSSDGSVCCALGFNDAQVAQMHLTSEQAGADSEQATAIAVHDGTDPPPHPPAGEGVVADQHHVLTAPTVTIRNPTLLAQLNSIAEAARNPTTDTATGGVVEYAKVPQRIEVAGVKAEEEIGVVATIGPHYDSASIDFYKGTTLLATANVLLSDDDIPRAFTGLLQLALYIQVGTTVHLRPFSVPIPAPPTEFVQASALAN